MTTGHAESSGATGAPENTAGEPLLTPPAATALAVGVDLVEQERLVRTWERFGDRFLHKVFTATELEQAQGRIDQLVGRFAAKEACAKALGVGIGKIQWRDIEIVRLPSGKPALRLHGAAVEHARRLGLTAFDVSITDTQTLTMAVVVGVGVSR